MGLVIYLHGWLIFMGFHVGKYTIPMDPMGLHKRGIKLGVLPIIMFNPPKHQMNILDAETSIIC